tara:strand:+ start:330 stop:572 length:243 start_codon:yes stop_codon:yes gene_type:complete
MNTNKKLTIYDIKRLTMETSPYFFSRDTMKFFNQTLKDFKVFPKYEGRYTITAPRYDNQGKYMGETVKYFNPKNNKLESE